MENEFAEILYLKKYSIEIIGFICILQYVSNSE